MANLNDLPVDCIENVISLTSPKDACQLSLVSTWLRFSADSDQVWEKFLSADYQEILGRSTKGIRSMSKKQLFRRLCDNPLLIDNETKSFWVDKSTGKKCFLLGSRALSMSWFKWPEYWWFKSLGKSRFGWALELFGAYRVELSGAINPRMLSPDTMYGVYLVFDAEGGHVFEKLVRAWVGIRGQQPAWSSRTHECVWRGGDRWMEVEVGEVMITGEEDADLMIRLEERREPIMAEHSDLIFEGIEIRVKH